MKNASTKFKNELMALIFRWSKESDIQCFEMIGALEVAKVNLLDMMKEEEESID